MGWVEIHYRRPPDRIDIFEQELIVDRDDCKITLHESPPPDSELAVGDRTILEPGAAIVWFVFPGGWHDVGRFHLRDGTFTGYYINLIAPPKIEGRVWHMFDLCLDLWVPRKGKKLRVLDRDEFDEAVDRGWIDSATAERARLELEGLISAVHAGDWPPAIVRDHDLARIRSLRSRRPDRRKRREEEA